MMQQCIDNDFIIASQASESVWNQILWGIVIPSRAVGPLFHSNTIASLIQMDMNN